MDGWRAFHGDLGKTPTPPEEMAKAWLEMVDSKVSEVEKKAKKRQEPAEKQKE